MRRLEALPPRYPGLAKLKGAALSAAPDEQLDALADQVRAELGMPMSALMLLLERVVLLRATKGLPTELEAARAFDRDASFCQVIVRDGEMLEVSQAAIDTRVPQDLVDRYNCQSYIGAPVMLGGEVVGAMCALDTKARAFDDHDRASIRRAAALASARLEELALGPRDRARALHDRAVRPAFGELRNRLVPLLGNIEMMQVALVELRALQRMVAHVTAVENVHSLELMSRGDEMLDELSELLVDLGSDSEQIQRGILALERASISHDSACTLRELVDAGVTLAHHRCKLVGGTRVHGATDAILAPALGTGVAVRAMSAVLGGLVDGLVAGHVRSGIDIDFGIEEDIAVVRAHADVDHAYVELTADQLRSLVGDNRFMHIGVQGESVELGFSLQSPM